MSSTSSDASATSATDQTLPHDDYGPQINVTIWSLSIMAAGWLVLRIYCKCLRRKQLWWDDYVLIASVVVLFLGVISLALATSFGFGKHTYDVKPDVLSPMRLVSNFAGFFMIIGAAWSKSSFALTLMRISTGWQRIFLWFIIASINVVLGCSALFTWIRCWPIETAWNPVIAGTCWPASISINYNVFTSAYSGATDITLALLPWKILWGLRMDKKEKFSAMAAMSMGIFAGITSFVKIHPIRASADADIGDSVQLVVLATAEISITIMAASVPILRAFARDKVTRAGPFLALDETERWTRTRVPRIEFYTGSLPGGNSEITTGLDSFELEPPTKKKWDAGKQRIQHLSQIEESDESVVDQRASRINPSWSQV